MHLKLIVKILLALIVLFNLTGCAAIAKKEALKRTCDNVPILYTNLKSSPSARHYVLPDGSVCPKSEEAINSV